MLAFNVQIGSACTMSRTPSRRDGAGAAGIRIAHSVRSAGAYLVFSCSRGEISVSAVLMQTVHDTQSSEKVRAQAAGSSGPIWAEEETFVLRIDDVHQRHAKIA